MVTLPLKVHTVFCHGLVFFLLFPLNALFFFLHLFLCARILRVKGENGGGRLFSGFPPRHFENCGGIRVVSMARVW